MKKSLSSPSFTSGDVTAKRSSIRRNALSWNHLPDTVTAVPPDKVELIGKLDSMVPSSISQKLVCYESYGFPSDIIHSTASSSKKAEQLLDVATCLVTPEDPPSESRILQVRNIQRLDNTTNRAAVEERFQRMFINIRKRRKQVSMSL